jgi:hypothetical protein
MIILKLIKPNPESCKLQTGIPAIQLRFHKQNWTSLNYKTVDLHARKDTKKQET